MLQRVLVCCVLASLACRAQAVTPSKDEFDLCSQWGEAMLGTGGYSERSSIQVAQEDVADAIVKGRSWRGTPFQIGQRTYAHGLAFNSTKRLSIHLDRPATRFTSDVGLENNDDTRLGVKKGKGSVTFQVRVAGQEVVSTSVMWLTNEPVSLNVALNGAREFEISVGDGGDGRGWDQALWGGAAIEMQDGSRVRLQDLPLSSIDDTNLSRVSFVYGGKPSAALLGHWIRETRQAAQPGGAQTREVLFHDPETGLEMTIAATQYPDFPALEWVVRFKNTGSNNTPILEKIQALDTVFPIPTVGEPTLHWAKGGVASFDDFAPQKTLVRAESPFVLSPADGRSSSEVLPFFNVEGAGSGVVLAIGWSGRWASSFQWAARDAVRIVAGMASTHLSLHPGEEIRSPRMLALFYQGDRWRGQNLLRQYILAHHRPQKDGQPLTPPITCGNWGGTTGAVHAQNIRDFISHKLPMEYYWIDAGWYGRSVESKVDDWATTVGDWDVKTNLYPQGFKPLSETLRQDGRDLMVWFEPERVYKDTPWAREHKNWLFDAGNENFLMNLGNPEACRFVTDFISKRIAEFGLGCYRQDFNMDPAGYWQRADAPDRQGMSEIRHIEGLYDYWDGLLARHPHLIIDNCASGGRRIDLETVGRATPFWRTDGPRDPIAHQCHTYGLMAWVPLSATSQDREGDDYEFRSSMSSSLCLNWNHSGDGPAGAFGSDFPFDWAKRTLDQYVRFRDDYLGDYYPLTEYSQSADQWMAYQLNRSGDGLVVVLRRPQSPYEEARFPLRDLDTTANYQITNLDTGVQSQTTGRELMEKGLPVEIVAKPGSALVLYKKL